VVRAHFEEHEVPWTHAAISGWILDPDRKKMSKSKGNVVTPMDLLDEYSSDAVRYWAASGRPGTDTAFDVGQMKIGRRLAIKVLNASKFVLSNGTTHIDAAIHDPVDQALIAGLATMVDEVTAAFEDYNYARALELTETFFWNFTDDYLELVKERVYGAQGEAAQASAQAALLLTLGTLLKLFAPFLPFATEEAWSWWQDGSIHRSPWPIADELRARAASGDPALLADISIALTGIRKLKSDAKVSMRAPLASVTITADPAAAARLEFAVNDLRAAGCIEHLILEAGTEIGVIGELAN